MQFLITIMHCRCTMCGNTIARNEEARKGLPIWNRHYVHRYCLLYRDCCNLPCSLETISSHQILYSNIFTDILYGSSSNWSFWMVVQDLVWELLQCSNKEVRSISLAMLGPSTKSTCSREMLSRCKNSPLRVETELVELCKDCYVPDILRGFYIIFFISTELIMIWSYYKLSSCFCEHCTNCDSSCELFIIRVLQFTLLMKLSELTEASILMYSGSSLRVRFIYF